MEGTPTIYDLSNYSDALYDKISGGLRLLIDRDTQAKNPREVYENTWCFSFTRRRHSLGDLKYTLKLKKGSGWIEYSEALERKFGAQMLTPVYIQDRGEVVLSTVPSASIDGECIGFAFLTEELLAEIFRKELTPEQLSLRLQAELQMYEDYLNDNVYKYQLIDVVSGLELASHGNYYGMNFDENGLTEEIPKQFIEDVRRSLPGYTRQATADNREDLSLTHSVTKEFHRGVPSPPQSAYKEEVKSSRRGISM